MIFGSPLLTNALDDADDDEEAHHRDHEDTDSVERIAGGVEDAGGISRSRISREGQGHEREQREQTVVEQGLEPVFHMFFP